MYFELCVFEPVSQPAVKIIGNCSTPNITLSCSASNGTNVTFHWRKQSLFGAIGDTYKGTELVIDDVNGKEQHEYRCIAENPVSNSTSDPVKPKLCNGNKGLLWIILLSLIPVSLFVWYSIISKETGRATQEHNEQTIAFTSKFIEPTYTTLLKPRRTV
ncbi:carcinoembryonic antigen-related cell adhesion molecule 21-like [Heptranchias perlo]|uniref:carcinoembryonic antigen-related cell adhesion molecule 21-like n=1 Tax=Heptranchias perlo TaxID=212740 RepID=UPI00355AB6C4